MSKWLFGLLDRIFVVIGAVVFFQIPLFFQHYAQRLGGHVAELRGQIDALQRAADGSGKTLQAYIQKFQSQADLDFAAQGHLMESMLRRYAHLDQAYNALINATILNRPLAFLQYFQPDIARQTVADFSFGLTFTTEALVYAFLGLCAGYLFFWILAALARGAIRLIRRKHRNA